MNKGSDRCFCFRQLVWSLVLLLADRCARGLRVAHSRARGLRVAHSRMLHMACRSARGLWVSPRRARRILVDVWWSRCLWLSWWEAGSFFTNACIGIWCASPVLQRYGSISPTLQRYRSTSPTLQRYRSTSPTLQGYRSTGPATSRWIRCVCRVQEVHRHNGCPTAHHSINIFEKWKFPRYLRLFIRLTSCAASS